MASPVSLAKAHLASNGFTEVTKRLKGGIEARNPSTNGKAMMLSVGNRAYHFGDGPFDENSEIDTSWQPTGGGLWDWEMLDADYHAFVRDSVPVSYRYETAGGQHYVELTITAVEWVNDEGQSEQVTSFQQVTPSISDDEIKWTGVSSGWDVRLQSLPTKFVKWIDISSLNPPTIGGTNIRLRFQLSWQRSNGLEIWADGSKWDEKNNTWVETSGNIDFIDETSQEVIFTFARPFGHDDTLDNDASMVQRVKRTGVNFYSEIFTPWTWLQTAQYPVHLDTTIDVFTGASSDDGHQNASDGGVVIVAGTPTLDYTTIDWFGFRFQLTSAIGTSDTIDTAHGAMFSVNKDDPDLTIWAQKTDNPATFDYLTDYDISNRATTTASVSWIATGLGNNARHNTSSIVSIVEELAGVGYLDGGSDWIVIVFGANDADCNWRQYFYDQGANYPELYIAFTAGGGNDLTAENVIFGVPVIGAPTIAQTFALTAQNVVAGVPVVGSPTISQPYNLTAENVVSGIPVVGSPTIGQTFELTAENVVSGVPVIGSPDIGQIWNLTAENVIFGVPVVTDPDVGQIWNLTSDNVIFGVPIVGEPTIGQTFELTAENVISGVPVVGAPTITQSYDLIAEDVIFGVPVVGASIISQTFNLTSENVVTGVPVVGSPTISQQVPYDLIAEDVIFGVPVVGAPTIAQTFALTAEDVIFGVPIVGEPTISQTFALTSENVVSGVPVVGEPFISQELTYDLVAEDVIFGVPVVGSPTISQIFVLTADNVVSGVPVITDPTLSQDYNLTAEDVISGVPFIGAPIIAQTFNLIAENVVAGIPIVQPPTLWWGYALTADNIVAGIPIITDPAISQLFNLIAENVVSGIPVVGAPLLIIGELEIPDERVYRIPFEDRTIYVDEYSRVIYVEEEDRTI